MCRGPWRVPRKRTQNTGGVRTGLITAFSGGRDLFLRVASHGKATQRSRYFNFFVLVWKQI